MYLAETNYHCIAQCIYTRKSLLRGLSYYSHILELGGMPEIAGSRHGNFTMKILEYKLHQVLNNVGIGSEAGAFCQQRQMGVYLR